jgi:hypothetical protein
MCRRCLTKEDILFLKGLKIQPWVCPCPKKPKLRTEEDGA